jgi:hypothetical protein
MGLSFTIAAGPRQRSHSQIRVSRNSWSHFTASGWILPNLEARSPYLYPPGTGWPGYNLRHWVPISSLPTTRRATVEVFEPASTRKGYFTTRFCPRYAASAWTAWETPPRTVPLLLRVYLFQRSVFTEPIPSNGSLFWLHFSGFEPSCHM